MTSALDHGKPGEEQHVYTFGTADAGVLDVPQALAAPTLQRPEVTFELSLTSPEGQLRRGKRCALATSNVVPFLLGIAAIESFGMSLHRAFSDVAVRHLTKQL